MNISWLKLDLNILDDSKIKIVRKMPDGDKIFVLWVGILCLAMKSGRPGVLEIGDGVPFDDQMLASHFEIPISVVRLGLKVFGDLKMIQYLDDGSIFVKNFEEHQTLGKIVKSKEVSRKSSQKYREKAQIKIGDGHVTMSDGEVTPQNRIDKNRIDKNREEENRINKNIYNGQVNSVCEYWNESEIIFHHNITDKTKNQVKKSLKEYPIEQILVAIHHYKEVLTSPDHFFNYKWPLKDFLSRGLEKFLDEADPLNNFKNNNTNKTDDQIKILLEDANNG